MLKKLGGIGVAILIALGFFAFNMIKEKASAPEAGECVVVSGSSESPDVDTDKCGPDTLWKVQSTDGQCDETELNYYVEIRGAKATNLCLDYDVEVGDCLETVTDDSDTQDKSVACDKAPAANTVIAKVTKVETTTSDIVCAEGEFALPNVKRKTGICLAPAA